MRYRAATLSLAGLLLFGAPIVAQPTREQAAKMHHESLEEWFASHVGSVTGVSFVHPAFVEDCQPSDEHVAERDALVLETARSKLAPDAQIASRKFYKGAGFSHISLPQEVLKEYISRLDEQARRFFADLGISQAYPHLDFKVLNPIVGLSQDPTTTSVYLVSSIVEGECFGSYEISARGKRYGWFTDAASNPSRSVTGRKISYGVADGKMVLSQKDNDIFLSIGSDATTNSNMFLSELLHVAIGEMMVRYAEDDINKVIAEHGALTSADVNRKFSTWLLREEAVIHAITNAYIRMTTGKRSSPDGESPRYALLPQVESLVSERGVDYVFNAWRENPALIFP